MSIAVRVVEKYDDKVFKDLVHRNLESVGVFIPEWDYQEAGDTTFSKQGLKIRVAAFDGDTLVGLSWGEAITKNRFMMHMSLVESEYRGRGVYSEMLSVMLSETKDYDEVDSCHQIFNNRIIAAKLRKGFYIVGMDQSIIVGPRVSLRYFHNKRLLNLMKFRVGLCPDPQTSIALA